MLTELLELYDYNRWANDRTLGAVARLSEEELHRPLGNSFPSVFETVCHILMAEWIWLERWEGRSPKKGPEIPDWRSLMAGWSAVVDRQRNYLEGLNEPDLTAIVEYRTMAGVESASPLWQLLRHVVNHSTYHRGQVTTLLRQLGAEAVATDLIFYYRDRPAAGTAAG